jgi:hypothetical protein
MLIAGLILFFSILAPLFAVLGGLMLWRARQKRDKRRSPLKDKVLNLPGEHLRKTIAKHSGEYAETAAMALIIGPLLACAWLFSRMARVDWSRMQFGVGDALFPIVAVGVVAACLWKMIGQANQVRKYREGLDAELTVAQYLMQLIADGGLVFHDFPADRFNIDHIVVGRSAVFAIETKSRRKPEAKGRESARVIYDGKKLEFPNHVTTKPIEQARFQAEWLAKFLASGAGETVRVIPVVALPGWFVERTSKELRPDVIATNCYNSKFMMSDNFGAPISDSLRRRIAHALFEKYPSLDEFLGDRA